MQRCGIPIEETPDLLRLIFGYLDEIKDITNTSQVCRKWNILLWSCVKKLDIALCKKKNPQGVLSKMTRLQVLNVCVPTSDIIHQWHIDFIGKLEYVRELSIERCKDLQFQTLQNLYHLESLSLYDCSKTEDLSFLSETKKLKHLCLSKCVLSKRGFDVLASLHDLQKLYLWNTGAKNSCIAKLGQLTNLDTLDISSNSYLTNTCIEKLTNLTKLTLLDTSYTCITDGAVFELKKCAKSLRIGYVGNLQYPVFLNDRIVLQPADNIQTM